MKNKRSGRKRSTGPARVQVALGPKFEQALHFALQKHAGQTRKGTLTPYVAHLMSVASLVLEAGGDEELAIAALLHDVVEDCGGLPVLKEIRKRFGERVSNVVKACSDSFTVPKPPWRERKEAYLKRLRSANEDILLVSTADKLHNARSILSDHHEVGEQVWERFQGKRDGTLWYYRALVAELPRTKRNRLMQELKRVVEELESISGG